VFLREKEATTKIENRQNRERRGVSEEDLDVSLATTNVRWREEGMDVGRGEGNDKQG